MNDDLKSLMDHFDREGIHYQKLGNDPALRLIFEQKNGIFDCFVMASQEPRSLECVTVFPVKVPQAKRNQMAELLHRVNQYTRFGYLRLDMDNGRVTSKSGIVVGPDSILDDYVIRSIVAGNLTIADDHLPAVQKVIFGNVSPKDALNLPIPSDEADSEDETPSRFGGRLGRFFEASDN